MHKGTTAVNSKTSISFSENAQYLRKNPGEILYLNAQSLIKNYDEVCQLIYVKNPTIVGVVETHVTQEISDSEIDIKGYITVRCNSESRHTGGVVVYISENIKHKVMYNNSKEKNFWAIGVKSYGRNSFLLGVLYHSPNGKHGEFLEYVEDLFQDIDTKYKGLPTILCGDFNINWLKEDTNTKRLMSIVELYGLEQIVKEPTRVTLHSATLIDLILTNKPDRAMYTNKDMPRIGDHNVFLLGFRESKCGTPANVMASRPEGKSIVRRNWRQYNADNFRSELAISDYKLESTDVNLLSQVFVSNLTKAKDVCLPLRQITMNSKVKAEVEWINEDIKRAMKERDNMYEAAKITNDILKWDRYKIKRNEVCSMLRRAKKVHYFNKIDENRGDSKKMWKVLKGMISDKDKQVIPEILTINGEEVNTDNLDIANKLNSYFIKSIEEIIKSIGTINDTDEIQLNIKNTIDLEQFKRNNDTCKLDSFHKLSIKELDFIVRNLKNNGGGTSDGITAKLLKDAYPTIRYNLLNIVNASLQEGVFPDSWKEALIVPIPKVKNTIKVEEHRPINMLPIFEKILEIAAHVQLEKYFSENNLLVKNQSGFRKRHSCETAIQWLLSEWTAQMNQGNSILVVFLDFKRAFETVNRKRLLHKLKFMYGIEGKVLQWLEDYLTNRCQKTVYNDIISDSMDINIGVPQGSVLGPFLFLIYINDIILSLSKCNINMYADDTVIFYIGKDINEMLRVINEELSNIEDWLKINVLKLNVKKSKWMLLGVGKLRDDRLNIDDKIVMDHSEMERVYIYKYLGIMIDDKLNFKEHVLYVVKKIRKKIGFLTRISSYVTFYTRLLIYNTIIRPHFSYCITVLYQAYVTDVCKLQILQNKGMRTILKCNKYTAIKNMLDCLEWLSVEQELELNGMVYLYKAENRLLPEYMFEKMVRIQDIHSHKTRTGDLGLYLEACNRQLLYKSLFYVGVRKYNLLPRDIRLSKHVQEFKYKVKLYIKSREGN